MPGHIGHNRGVCIFQFQLAGVHSSQIICMLFFNDFRKLHFSQASHRMCLGNTAELGLAFNFE